MFFTDFDLQKKVIPQGLKKKSKLSDPFLGGLAEGQFFVEQSAQNISYT